ncbi:hypothetical protein [Litoribacillus peritrichatus]|uniref:Uncharacterized protein n=1 Tax=Litoribacillus peritrichatus TaxID=718191 RepID=A0ABP7M949_9GAMM
MNFARNLFACVLIAILISGCKLLLPKTFDEGETHFTSKQYDRAISAYLRADQEKPDNAHIKQGLIKAYAYKAVSQYEDAQNRPAEDIDKKIELYQQAREANNKARNTLAAVKALEPVSPDVKTPSSRPGQLLLPPNTDEMEYSAKIKLYEKTLMKHKAYVAEALLEEENNQQAVIKGLKSAIALMTKKPDGPVKAYEAYKPFDKYAPYMAKAEKTKKAIEKTAINFYEARGLYYVSKDKFALAHKDFKAAKEISESSAQATAGILAVTAKQQIINKKFEDAFETLNEIQKQHGKSKFYGKHIDNVRTQVVNRGIANAKKYTQSASMPDKATAFEIYHRLKPIAQPSASLTRQVDLAISSLQHQVANDLTARAMVLNQQNSFAYSSNISALLANAYGFSEKAAMPYKQMASRANQITHHKLNMPVLFTTQGKKANQQKQFSEWLDGEIYDSIPKMDIQNVTASDLLDLPNQGKGLSPSNVFSSSIPYDHSEVVFMLDLKKYNFKETGRDKPKRKSSKYVSKRYKIHNDAWDRAKDRLEDAKEAYEDAKVAAEELYRICKREASQAAAALGPFGDIAAGAACRFGTNALSSELSGLNDARDEYNRTPKRIEKKEISRYRYEEYTVQVKGELVADLIAYDRRNKKTFKLEPIRLSVNKSGKILKGVEREDVNGLKNGETKVPEIDAIIEKKERSAFKHTRAQIAIFLEDHRWKRFCYQGEVLNNKKLTHAATDAYSQCIQSAPREQKNSKEIIAANKAIQSYMGFSPDMVAKYGANKDYLNFSNKSHQLSDSEIVAAKKANTLAFISQPTIQLPSFDIDQAVASLRSTPINENSIGISPAFTGENTQTVSLETPAQ